MKIAVLAMVKNEADIIESFVRHNLLFADEMYILDNDSTDNTLLILKHLHNEGLPIQLFQSSMQGYQQQVISTSLLNHIKDKTDADVFMFLDADEFICLHPNYDNSYSKEKIKSLFQIELEKVKQHGVCGIQWLNYLPVDIGNNCDYINHFHEFVECKGLNIHQKVIFSRDILDKITLTQGNHELIDRNTGQHIQHIAVSNFALAHLPTRSKEQIISKILTSAISISSRHVGKDESFHVFNLKEKIVNSNYQLSMEDCREFAYYYGVPTNYYDKLTRGFGKISPDYIEHKYLHLNNISVIHSLRIIAETFADKSKRLELELAKLQNTMKE